MSEKKKSIVPKEKIAEFCRRNKIRKLSLFGSALRDDFGPDSDVDFLVDLQPGRSALEHIALIQDLEELLGRKVDVVSDKAIHWYIRDKVHREAVPL